MVTKVFYNAKLKVQFLYNYKGFRSKKISYTNDVISKTTDYISDATDSVLAIYENKQLKELPIYGANRLGIYNKVSNTSVYQLTDHLGNVRAVIAKQGNNAVALTSATDYYSDGMACLIEISLEIIAIIIKDRNLTKKLEKLLFNYVYTTQE